MAAIVVTAAEVLPTATTTKQTVIFGGTITAGMWLYLDTTDNTYKAADADALASAKVAGMALCSGGDGQYGVIATGGAVDPGGTVAVGEPYFLHTDAGGFGVRGELTSGDFATYLGYATTAAVFNIQIQIATVALAA